MKRSQTNPLQILWRLILVLSLVVPATLIIDIKPARAGGGLPPLIGMIPAHMRRNRVYRTAESYMRDKNEYYDTLRETAAQQLLDRELEFGLRDNQVAAYIKVVNLIEQERQTMVGFAEGEKKAAHDQFIATANSELEGLILSTTPVTRVLGAFTNGINSSQGFIESAITKLTGGAGGFLADVAKVRRIAERMGIAGQLIGGPLGEALRKGSTTIAKLTKPIDLVEADLIQVMDELGALGGKVSDLQDKGYKPVSSQTARDVAITLITGEGDPAISLIADLLVAKHGGGGGFRDRATDVMLGAGAARCQAKEDQIKKIMFKMEMDPEGEEENEPEIFPSCSTAEIPSLIDEVAEVEFPEAEDIAAAEDNDTADADQADETDTSQTTDSSSEGTEADPPSSSSEYIWVLENTVTNINNDQTAFYGGGSDPYWFPEARFEGKSAVFTCSGTSFTVKNVDVDHGYEYHNVTLTANFDAPPAQMDPGQEVELNASASGSGAVNEGSGSPGILFQYHVNNNGLDPVLGYSPWHPEFDGKSSQSWIFDAPFTSAEGGEFTISAGLWNTPPCHVIWTYRSQLNQNRVEAPPDEEAGSPPSQTEADPHCQALREEVAEKVSIARGADTADLELGIIGHVLAYQGDVQLNYCEGGGAQVEKGTAIRVGDCIKTGSPGLARFVLNDRDNKYNADPTSFGMGSNSEMCFTGFTVHRDDGKPGWIDLLRGAVRVITHGWQPDNGLSVRVSVRAAVTIASDILLDYDPDLDLLHTYVNEGNVVVENIPTGDSQMLKDNQLLITHQNSIGTVERMNNQVWKDILEENELDLEETLPVEETSSRFSFSLILIGGVICGGGALLLVGGGLLIYRQQKKKSEEAKD